MLDIVYYTNNLSNELISSIIGSYAFFCQETGAANAQGQVKRTVDTADYRSSAGQWLDQKPVQVIHQQDAFTTDSNTSGGVLTNAAVSVVSTLESAKEALSRK